MDNEPALEVPNQGDVAFGDLMDALAPESPPEAGGVPEAAAPGAPAAAGGAPPSPAQAGAGPDGGSDAAAGRPVEPAEGVAGGAVDADERPAGGDPQQPAAIGEPATWGADASAVAPEIAELSLKIEENLVNGYRSAAFEDTRKEYERYFKALEVHPRMLVGTEVPSMTGEGTETLKSTEDARDWQEAVKTTLAKEIEDTARTWMQDATGFLGTIHASVDLFKNNPDLIPGTKGFNRRLADDFAAMMEPYEVRNDGKLMGYSIPVQPIIDRLRKTQPTPAPQQTAPPPAKKVDPPQRGISSKAPTSSEAEDFSTLFGTIGLPQLRI